MYHLNNQNGGLILKYEDQIFLTDINTYKGITIIRNLETKRIEGVSPWFMNKDKKDEYFYYSDESKKNKLCKMKYTEKEEKIIVDDPVYLVQSHEDSLYYIDLSDGYLYRCDLFGKHQEVVIKDQVTTYTINNRKIWYSNETGIWQSNLNGAEKEKISEATGECIANTDNKVIFCNVSKDNCITIIDLKECKEYDIQGSYASHFNIYENYLFFAHKREDCALYRYDMLQKTSIKFASETADYIHIIEDKVIFYDIYKTHKWMQVAVTGGKTTLLYDDQEGAI